MISFKEEKHAALYFIDQRYLRYQFREPSKTASWAIVGGGIGHSKGVLWMQVTSQDLRPPIEPRTLLQEKMKEQGLESWVGLMTSAKLENVSLVTKSFGDYWVQCIATVGLGNAMRIGEPPSPSGRIGTINVVVECNVSLTDQGLLEGLSMISEAKSLTLLESGIQSYMSSTPATGTGTDCTVIASPVGAKTETYCGKHTQLGHLIGTASYEAINEGIAKWILDNPKHKLLGGKPWEKSH